MPTISKLTVDLRTNHAKFTQGMDSARKRLKGFEKSSLSAGKALAGLFGVGIGIGLTATIKQAIDAGDEIDKLSTRLGIGTEALSQYRHVAELSGISFKNLTLAFQRQTRRIAEAAQGTGEAQNALKELGLSAEELSTLSVDQQFEVLADAFQRVESQSDKLRLAFKLFDSEGVAVLQTMTRGAAGIREMRQEADRLGLTLTEEAVEGLVRAKDAGARLEAAWSGLSQTATVELAPVLADLADSFREHLPAAVEVTVETFRAFRHFILEGYEAILRGVSPVIVAFGELAQSVGRFRDDVQLTNFGTMTKALGQVLNIRADQIDQMQHDLVIAADAVEKTGSSAESSAGKFREMYNPAIQTAAEQTKALKDQQAELQKIMDEGKAVFDATRTPIEALQIEMERLDELLAQGAINFDTYSRAVFNAQEGFEDLEAKAEDTGDKIGEFALQAARNIQDSFADFLFDPFDKGVEGLVDSFDQAIRRMIANAAAAQLSEALLGDFDSTGKVGGLLGGLFDGLSFPGFAGGTDFAPGGLATVGEFGREVVALPRGSQVIPNNELGSLGGGVTVMNNFTISGPMDRRSQQQIADSAFRGARRATERNA